MRGQALIIYQLSNIPVGEYLANARMFWPSRQVRTVRMVYSSCPINSDAVANLLFFCSRLRLKRDHVRGQINKQSAPACFRLSGTAPFARQHR